MSESEIKARLMQQFLVLGNYERASQSYPPELVKELRSSKTAMGALIQLADALYLEFNRIGAQIPGASKEELYSWVVRLDELHSVSHGIASWARLIEDCDNQRFQECFSAQKKAFLFAEKMLEEKHLTREDTRKILILAGRHVIDPNCCSFSNLRSTLSSVPPALCRT